MKLPLIKKLAINDLSLFNHDIERQILPGINMIIGGNGIGKTTLINTILYALFGNCSYDKLNPNTGRRDSITPIDKDYFKGRIDPEDQNKAIVYLCIQVGNKEIEVTRALYRPEITQFKIKNVGDEKYKVYTDHPDELENKYKSTMEKLLELESFDHFVFLVTNLLLFDEDRRTLVWDTEPQNRIIRLLFLEREFDKRFDKLSEQYTRFDTDARHKSERRKDIKRAIERWLKTKKEAIEDSGSQPELERKEVEIKIANMQNQVEEFDNEITTQKSSIDSEMAELKSLMAHIDRVELGKMPLKDELEKLEKEFYSNVYKTIPPEYVLVLENLIQKGVCQVCHSSNDNLKDLGNKLKEKGECLVCRSPIVYKKEKSLSEEEEHSQIELINNLREKLEKLEIEQNALIEAQIKTNSIIEEIHRKISLENKKKKQVEAEIFELKAKYLSETGEEPFADEEYDKWLNIQNRDIAKLDTDIAELYRKGSQIRNELKELNDNLVSLLNDVNSQLTPIFSDFASKFLGTSCRLVVSHRTVNKKPVAFMYPLFNEKDRGQKEQVSESQRFFLDQAFRMALVTWYSQRSNQPTFFIVETPEGSLDLAYEKNVADMYVEFAKQGHSIIVTSNLNASNFLLGLYNHLGSPQERKERTIDLLKYGKLTAVHKTNIPEFNQRLSDLKLEPMNHN